MMVTKYKIIHTRTQPMSMMLSIHSFSLSTQLLKSTSEEIKDLKVTLSTQNIMSDLLLAHNEKET